MIFRLSCIVFTLAILTGCGGSTGPATPRLLSIEYTPDNTNEDKVETFFTYFDSGFLDKVEVEVDGDETQEQVFYYDDEDRLNAVEISTKGDFAFEFLAEIDLDDEGRATRITFEGAAAGETPVNGEDRPYTYSYEGETSASYNQGGSLTSYDDETETRIELTLEGPDGEFPYETITTSESDSTYSWNSDGLLTGTSTESSSETETRQDGEETDTSRTETDESSDYTYRDGVLAEVESETTTKVGEESTRTSLDVETSFNEDGSLVEYEGTEKVGEQEEDYELEIEYDEGGRITRIEDRDGNRWDFEYDGDEVARGVSMYSDRLPGFIDLEGKQVMEAVSLYNHFAF